MLTIRLQRIGKKKFPVYRLVISDKARDTQGKHLEILGNYNPHDKDGGFVVKADRIQHWLGHGAQMSNTVHNLFINQGLITDKKDKRKSVTISNKRTKKMEDKKAAAAEADKPAEAESAPSEDAKAEEASTEEVKEEPKAEAPAEETKEEVKTEEAPAEEAKAEEKPEEASKEEKEVEQPAE